MTQQTLFESFIASEFQERPKATGKVASEGIGRENAIRGNAISDDYEFTNPHPPCETLKQWRIAAGLGQAQLSHWCYLASIAVAIESREPGSVTPLHSAHPMSLLEACIFTQWHSRLDSTHISKFEKGHQVPWRNAQKILAIVFSAIQKRPVSTEELFPELANGSSMTLEMIEEFERRRAADLMTVM